jgi:bifunctional non-homologous end joining protein LigD
MSDRPAAFVEPMLAQLVRAVDHRPARRTEWRYERKLDGLRCLAVRNGAEVELWSRNRLSFTARFPSVAAALRALPADNFTMDGEVVAFDGDRTSFSRLQRPDGAAPPSFCVFDLVHLLGRDLTELPLSERQALLARLAPPSPEGAALWVVPPLDGDPVDLLRQACEEKWEGLVAKRVAAPYRPGRSSDWQKLKCTASQELVVAGWTDPTGSRVGLGALVLGWFDEAGQLQYAGKVGSGFDRATLTDLSLRLLALAVGESPYAAPVPLRGVHWVRPELVAEIVFTEWTADGRLRHPTYHGLRPDKDARSVRREVPAALA